MLYFDLHQFVYFKDRSTIIIFNASEDFCLSQILDHIQESIVIEKSHQMKVLTRG